MIVHINHRQADRAALTGEVVSTLISLLEGLEGNEDEAETGQLNVHLDWIQYKGNFRKPITVRRAIKGDRQLPLVEVAVDLRQIRPETLRHDFTNALSGAPQGTLLEEFGTMRSSVIWRFNNLFWQYLQLWEKASGKGYEKALPSGSSDGHNAAAIEDSVAELWTLLKDMENQNLLPPEVFILEMGAGTGQRAVQWLDGFLELDRQRGTKYYSRLKFLLADYSQATLNRAKEAVRAHRDVASFLMIDALDPYTSLSFLRYKVLFVHLTNVYDNLPTDEFVVRDGQYYFVEVRSHIPAQDVTRICETFGVAPKDFVRTVHRLLEIGPEHVLDSGRGVEFWQAVWGALRLDERLIAIESIADAPLPHGLRADQVENLITEAPSNLRFQLSSGAIESFLNTMPLLHPRGYLQVQDIFVTRLADYAHSFRGPGKMDGSVVNWVNGALLAETAEQAGFDVHFAPFHYRKGSRTSILYTTHRE